MSNAFENEIRRLIDIYGSTQELKKSGYLEPVLNLMKDPAVVRNIMKKYDMMWRTSDEDYPELLNTWRKLLNKAQVAPNINPTVLDALFVHNADMTTVRPDNSNTVSDTIKSTYGGYEDNAASASIAAEPESSYGNSVSYDTDNEWNSIRRGHRPKKGIPVLIAGWHYAGAVEQCIGVWQGNGKWDLRVAEDYNKPKFTPLLWRRLPEVPDYIMEELPE